MLASHEIARHEPWMMRGFFLGILLGAVGLVRPVVAREFLVRDSGNKSVLADAIAAANSGDTIRISPGIYREKITLTKGVSLVGEPGVVLDPSEPLQLSWQAAPEVGAGVFRATSARKPATLFLGGRVLAELDERRAGIEGPWFWKTLLASGPPLGGFQFVRALWIYRSDEKAVYLHLEKDASPHGA